MRCVLLALILTAHALVPVAPSGDAASCNGSGLTTTDMHTATTGNEEQEQYGDYGYQESTTLKSSSTGRDSIRDLRNAEDVNRNE